jgi:hypothetical protein
MYMVKKKFGNFRNFSYLSVPEDSVLGLDDLKTCTHILTYSFPYLVEACALSETVSKELKSPQHFNP